MAEPELQISKTLALPLDFTTKTAAILAQRRKGKTYTASVLAEELVAARQPFVALDPTGAWWGLRASSDGQSEGLPVIVLGGQHGDVPLERTAGRVVADLVVDEPGHYVIDFSLFESGEAERQFAVDFAERLYRAKGAAGKDFPLHLFVDEADRFVPQQLRKGSNETSPRLLGAFEAIVRRGGLRGLGTTLISQRAAVVNKNVLEMIDVLIALRTVGPNDQAAVLAYVKAHGTDAEVDAFRRSLASLEIGEAWVWEPGAEPALFERVKIRERRTFNSSATPKPGQKRVEPKRMAPVDLAALRTRMAETIERAKADDPKELRKRIAELEKQLRERPATAPTERVVEVPAFNRKEFDAVHQRIAELFDAGIAEVSRAKINAEQHLVLYRNGVLAAAALGESKVNAGFTVRRERTGEPPPQSVPRSQRETQRVNSPASSGAALGKGEKMILGALIHHPNGCTRAQLTVLSGFKRSTRDLYVQRLTRFGHAEQRGDRIFATPNGAAALPDVEPLPTGRALQEHWLTRLPLGESAVLKILIDAFPNAVQRADIEAATSFKRSTRDLYVQRLARRELVKLIGPGYLIASEELFG